MIKTSLNISKQASNKMTFGKQIYFKSFEDKANQHKISELHFDYENYCLIYDLTYLPRFYLK